jgi:hypothetical protein
MNAERNTDPGEESRRLPVPPVPLMGGGGGKVAEDRMAKVAALLLPFAGATASGRVRMPATHMPSLGDPVLEAPVERKVYESPTLNQFEFNATPLGGTVSVKPAVRGTHVREDIFYVGDGRALEAAREALTGLRRHDGTAKFRLTELTPAKARVYHVDDIMVSATFIPEMTQPRRTESEKRTPHGAVSAGMAAGVVADGWVTSKSLAPKELRRRIAQNQALRHMVMEGAAISEDFGPIQDLEVVDLRKPEGMEMFHDTAERM